MNPSEASHVERPHPGWWLAIFAGMTLLGVLAFTPIAFTWWTTHLFRLPPPPMLVWIFIGAVALHVGEALYAFRLARRGAAPSAALGWMLQTLLLGFPSLRLLLRRARAT